MRVPDGRGVALNGAESLAGLTFGPGFCAAVAFLVIAVALASVCAFRRGDAESTEDRPVADGLVATRPIPRSTAYLVGTLDVSAFPPAVIRVGVFSCTASHLTSITQTECNFDILQEDGDDFSEAMARLGNTIHQLRAFYWWTVRLMPPTLQSDLGVNVDMAEARDA